MTPTAVREELYEGAFVLKGLLMLEECARWIEFSEELGFDRDPVTSRTGFIVQHNVRSNSRVIMDDPHTAESLFNRCSHQLPETWWGRQLCGLNERFRFYRYHPGQRFVRHTDAAFERNPKERSELSMLIYLNESMVGGETVFHIGKKKRIRVTPQSGMALVFNHRILHEGAIVENGCKYVLRTDVMYAESQ